MFVEFGITFFHCIPFLLIFFKRGYAQVGRVMRVPSQAVVILLLKGNITVKGLFPVDVYVHFACIFVFSFRIQLLSFCIHFMSLHFPSMRVCISVRVSFFFFLSLSLSFFGRGELSHHMWTCKFAID